MPDNLHSDNSIVFLRERAKMSRRAFAEYFNIPYKTIQNWELGLRKCPDYLIALMEYKLVNENILKVYCLGQWGVEE